MLGFNFFMTQHVAVLLIIDMDSAKSDVNGPKKKYVLAYFNKKVKKKNNKKTLKTYRPKLY